MWWGLIVEQQMALQALIWLGLRTSKALDGQTPDQVYYDHLTTRQTAA